VTLLKYEDEINLNELAGHEHVACVYVVEDTDGIRLM
jgi:hypothetical protein